MNIKRQTVPFMTVKRIMFVLNAKVFLKIFTEKYVITAHIMGFKNTFAKSIFAFVFVLIKHKFQIAINEKPAKFENALPKILIWLFVIRK